MKSLTLLNMKLLLIGCSLFFMVNGLFAQQSIQVTKDPRIDILGRKMAEYNEKLSEKLHKTSGYRLMLLSTSDRNQAMQVRTQLMQSFPGQTVYMLYQSPFIKLKFGNFLERSEAEDYRKQLIASSIIKGNIYIVSETVEVTAERIMQQTQE